MARHIGICVICGKEFSGTYARKYCSAECRKSIKRVVWNKGVKSKPDFTKRTGTIKQCKYCGKEFYIFPSQTNKKYCSVECSRKGSKPNNKTCPVCSKEFTSISGRKNRFCSKECSEISRVKSRMTGQTRACKECGKEFYTSKTSAKKYFCSFECYHANRWNGTRKEIRVCKFCQKEFECKHSSKNVTCSKRCSKLYRSQQNQGEKSRFWRGGKMQPYHKEWKTFRRLALERDGHKCSICGSTDRIQVHHIIPYRYSQNHSLDNLTTLCRSCHSSEEYKVNKYARDAFEKVRLLRLQSVKIKES